MKHVLMVDDEEDLVWTITRRMERERPDLRFEGVCDPVTALARVKQDRPDLLVTDLRMPGMSGLELLIAARREVPDLPVIVVTAYGGPEVRTEVQRAKAVQYLEKPLAFRALTEAMDRALSPVTGFTGAIELPMLPDLIQIYALSCMTGSLRITREGEGGAVWFDRGQIVHAECGELGGPDAFYRLLTWRGGAFRMEMGVQSPRSTVSVSWQELLVEGCRRLDEESREPQGSEPGPEAGSRSPFGARVWAEWGGIGGGRWSEDARIVAVSLETREEVFLQGTARGGPLAEPVAALVDMAERIIGATALNAFEYVTEGFGVAVTWVHGFSLALVFVDEWEGRQGGPRFRSDAARWREACDSWLGGQERREKA